MLLHQVVENLGHLTAGNVAVGLEAAVAVAVDDPLPHHGPDVVGGVSGDLGAVGKGQIRQRNVVGCVVYLRKSRSYSK